MLRLLDEKFGESTDSDEKLLLLKTAENSGSFMNDEGTDLEKIVLRIKLSLEDPKFIYDGLLLMNSLLKGSPTWLFEINAYNWMKSLCKIIEDSLEGTCMKAMACKIVQMIILKSKDHTAVKKSIAENLVSTFIVTLTGTSVDDEALSSVLDCLAVCMREMPGSCRARQREIKQFIELQLGYAGSQNMEHVAECVSVLPGFWGRTSGTSEQYASTWAEIAVSLLTELARSLTYLHAGEIDAVNGTQQGDEMFKLPRAPEDPRSAVLFHSTRFQLFSVCLVKMLRQGNRCVLIPTNSFINVIERAIKFSPEQVDSSAVVLQAVLPDIHHSTILLIEALLSCSPVDHLINVAIIGRILTNKFLSDSEKYHGESYCSVHRCALYRVLRTVLLKFSDHGLENFFPQLLMSAVNDIKPSPTCTQPALSEGYLMDSKRRSSERHHSRFANKNRSPEMSTDRPLDSSVCAEALQFISAVMYSVQGDLVSEIVKMLNDTVIGVILGTVQCSQTQHAPYDSAMCRVELYKTFLSIIINLRSVSSIYPLPLSASIFHTGESDPSAEVSGYCRHAAAVCSAIIHPERMLPKYRPPTKERAEQKRQVVPTAASINISSVQGSSNMDWHPANSNSNAESYAASKHSLNITTSSSHPIDNSSAPRNPTLGEITNSVVDNGENTDAPREPYNTSSDVICEEDHVQDVEEEEVEDEEDEEGQEEEEVGDEEEDDDEEQREDVEEEEEPEFDGKDDEEESEEEGCEGEVTEKVVNHQSPTGLEENDKSSRRLQSEEDDTKPNDCDVDDKPRFNHSQDHSTGNAISENGLGSSDSDGDSGKSSSRKRRRVDEDYDSASPEEALQCSSPAKISAGDVEETGPAESEIADGDVNSMMMDFVATSPDAPS